MASIEELGVAGHLDVEHRTRLRDLDVEVLWEIGIAGPWTPELLVKVHAQDERRVRGALERLGVAGPLDPAQLDQLLDIGLDIAIERAHRAALSGPDPDELMDVVRRG